MKDKKYDGSHKRMDEDFRKEITDLIEHLLNPKNIVLNKFNGYNISGREFLEYLKNYFHLFIADDLPHVQTIYESTIDQHMSKVERSCMENFKESVFKHLSSMENENQIKMLHEMSKNRALLMYSESKKMGNASHDAKYKKILTTEIDKLYEEYGQPTEESMKKLAGEMEKTRQAVEEKQKAEQERMASMEKTLEKMLEQHFSKELENARLALADFKLQKQRDEEIRKKFEKEAEQLKNKKDSYY